MVEPAQAGDTNVSAIKDGPFQLRGGLVVLKCGVVKCILYSVVKKGWICSTKKGPSSGEAGEPGGASPVKMIRIQDHGSPRCGCKAFRLLNSMRLPLTLTPPVMNYPYFSTIKPAAMHLESLANLCTSTVKSQPNRLRMTELWKHGRSVKVMDKDRCRGGAQCCRLD